jgi:hypothetical protein
LLYTKGAACEMEARVKTSPAALSRELMLAFEDQSSR